MGKSHTDSDFEDIAYLTLHFKSKKIIHFNCSWISPVKIRYMLIGGNKKMIIFNDLETTEKVKIYDTKYKTKTNPKNDRQILADYRVGDIFIPKLTTREGLSSMVEDFVSAIIDKTKPISNYDIGLQVVKILEAAQRSITNQGKEVKI